MGFKIYIPAREGSKGWKHKNRHLFQKTVDFISRLDPDMPVILDTDDEWFYEKAPRNWVLHKRDQRVAQDQTSLKETIVCNPLLKKTDTIIMLYLTYPERKPCELLRAIKLYKRKKLKSLICIEEPLTHPYMCLTKESGKYRQIIKHDLYRRQDYPECAEISHNFVIFNMDTLLKLNKNLYNDSITYFHKIKRAKDVDYEGDL
jgi:CMP-N-acetylneuraminic acid synthetase